MFIIDWLASHWAATTVLVPISLSVASIASAEPLADGTNRHFAHTRESPASPEAIWALWTDVQTWPTWDTEIEAVTLNGPIGLGQTGTLTSGGRQSRITVTAWDPPRSYAFATRLPLGSLVVTRTLQPHGEGTRFTHDVAFRGLGGRLLAPILGKKFRAALPVVMESLDSLASSPDSRTRGRSPP